MNKAERQAWDRAQIVLANFINQRNLTRVALAQFLGVHHNTIHNDEKILLEWCDSYKETIQITPLLPLGRGGRVRLNPYRTWLLLLCRFLVVFTGDRTEVIKFFISIDNQKLLTQENFQHLRKGIETNGTARKIKRVLVA
ncbi:hypothetical protein [Allocoleopsis sp.]|uniref:hypothetical protein n=1 Tax=Allocoleopsis sp. TaxID=3088169 RepID=UPI002FCEDE3D